MKYKNTKEAMYVERNTVARSCNHFFIGKTLIIAYSECVSVALVIQHVMRMRHIVICCQPCSKIFFPHCLINGTIFEKRY